MHRHSEPAIDPIMSARSQCVADGCEGTAVLGDLCLGHIGDGELTAVLEREDRTALRLLDLQGCRVSADRVLTLLMTGRPMDLCRSVIQGDLSLWQCESPRLHLTQAVVNGSLTAMESRFDSTRLDSCTIQGDLSFQRTTFVGGIRGRSLAVRGRLDLAACAFTSDADGPGDVDLPGLTGGGDARFDKAVVGGNLDLREAEIKGSLEVSAGQVSGTTSLSQVQVRGSLSLSGSTFSGRFSADRMIIGGYLQGRGTTFGDEVWIDSSFIGGFLSLSRATFETTSSLGDFIVIDSCSLDHVKAKERIDFRASASSVSLNDASIAQAYIGVRVSSPDEEAPALFLNNLSVGDRMRVESVPRLDSYCERLRQVMKRAAEGDTESAAESAGESCRHESEDPAGDSVEETAGDAGETSVAEPAKQPAAAHSEDRTKEPGEELAEVGGRAPQVIALSQTSLAGLTMARLDLSVCRFAQAYDVEKIKIEGFLESLPRSPTRLGWTPRRIIAEERLWRLGRTRGSDWERPEVGYSTRGMAYSHGEVPPGPAELTEIYRALRVSMESAGDGPGAADFYYGEMEMRRQTKAAGSSITGRLRNGGERLILWLYWMLSGYGLRASRSLLALTVAVLVAAWAFYAFGFAFPSAPFSSGNAGDVESNHPAWSAIGYALASTISLPGAPDAELTTGGLYVQIALRVTGPVLLGLSLLAIRGRVRR